MNTGKIEVSQMTLKRFISDEGIEITYYKQINGHRRIRTADFLHVKQAYWSSLKRNVLKNNHYIMRP